MYGLLLFNVRNIKKNYLDFHIVNERTTENLYILMNKHVKYGKNLIKTHNFTSVQYCWICKNMK